MSRDRLRWTTTRYIVVGEHRIPCSENLRDQANQEVGIHKNTRSELTLKTILWPLSKLQHDLFVDGFIKRRVGEWIRELATSDTVFLEIGCGNMSLRKFLPRNVCYNALDIQLSEFHLRRVLVKASNVNVALASATDIPLESNTVSLIVSTECFEHIPDIDRAIEEIHRVAMPKAPLICSIPNNYCYKYRKKGPHAQHVNNWTFEGFKDLMASHNFEFLKGQMKGHWIPLPLWLTRTSYQLPISAKEEYYNTNFFYVFQANK